MSMIGKTYLERGKPVVVLIKWDSKVKGAKRNVLIQREDGTLTVRPFRGLRNIKVAPAPIDAEMAGKFEGFGK